jgi:hypothetical protein
MKRKELTYFIAQDCITLQYRTQYISFNVYNVPNRKQFNRFKDELVNSHSRQYNNLNDIFGLAREHGIKGTAGHKPTVVGRIAF